jgi:hypothetical protein
MSKYRTTMSELLKKVYKEDGHQDVSSSKRMCRTIVEDAQQIEAKLNSMSPEDSLDTWWTNKLAVSANNLNKARDYIVNDIKEETEIEEISDKLKLKVLARKIQNMKDKAFKKTMSTIKSPLFADNEIEEGRMKDIFTADQEGKSAEEIAKIMKLPLKTVKSILGEATINPYVSMQRDKATGKMNYVVLDKDEKEAFRSTNQIVAQDYFKKNYNKLKEENLDEFTTDQIKLLKKSYGGMRGKTIAPQKANMLSKHLDRLDLLSLRQLVKEKIPFLSTLARNKIYRKTGKFEELEETPQGYALVQKAKEIAKKMAGNYSGAVKEIEKLQKGLSDNSSVQDVLLKANESLDEEVKYPHKMYDPKSGKEVEAKTPEDHEKYAKMGYKHNKSEEVKDTEKKESENKNNTIAALKDQINILKTKLENEKNKAVKPEPNPDTGEVPLTVGVAYKHFKDKKEKEVKEDVSEKAMTDREKRIQRAKDMIKYYDAQKKAALKGKNKELAKKMLKNDIEESVGQVQTRPDGKGNFNLIFRGKEIGYYHREGGKYVVYYDKDGDDYDQSDEVSTTSQAKKLAYDNMNEADLTKSQIKQVHKVADDLPKKDFKDRYGKEKGDAVRFGTATNMVKKKLGMKENTSAFNPTVHNKTLGVTSKDLDRAFNKLSQRAQSHVNDLLRTGMGTRDAIKKAKEKFKEDNISEDRRLYVETIAGLKKKAEKSGMPYSILKKVYDRGMAAWKSGHRPGASQQQWAFARVNSFVTKSSGTWGGADKDLAKQVRGK